METMRARKGMAALETVLMVGTGANDDGGVMMDVSQSRTSSIFLTF